MKNNNNHQINNIERDENSIKSFSMLLKTINTLDRKRILEQPMNSTSSSEANTSIRNVVHDTKLETFLDDIKILYKVIFNILDNSTLIYSIKEKDEIIINYGNNECKNYEEIKSFMDQYQVIFNIFENLRKLIIFIENARECIKKELKNYFGLKIFFNLKTKENSKNKNIIYDFKYENIKLDNKIYEDNDILNNRTPKKLKLFIKEIKNAGKKINFINQEKIKIMNLLEINNTKTVSFEKYKFESLIIKELGLISSKDNKMDLKNIIFENFSKLNTIEINDNKIRENLKDNFKKKILQNINYSTILNQTSKNSEEEDNILKDIFPLSGKNSKNNSINPIKNNEQSDKTKIEINQIQNNINNPNNNESEKNMMNDDKIQFNNNKFYSNNGNINMNNFLENDFYNNMNLQFNNGFDINIKGGNNNCNLGFSQNNMNFNCCNFNNNYNPITYNNCNAFDFNNKNNFGFNQNNLNNNIQFNGGLNQNINQFFNNFNQYDNNYNGRNNINNNISYFNNNYLNKNNFNCNNNGINLNNINNNVNRNFNLFMKTNMNNKMNNNINNNNYNNNNFMNNNIYINNYNNNDFMNNNNNNNINNSNINNNNYNNNFINNNGNGF